MPNSWARKIRFMKIKDFDNQASEEMHVSNVVNLVRCGRLDISNIYDITRYNAAVNKGQLLQPNLQKKYKKVFRVAIEEIAKFQNFPGVF